MAHDDGQEAREMLLKAVDLSATTPTAARARLGKWKPSTCRAYLRNITLAREWWERERRAARVKAERAGLTGIPAEQAAAFMPWPSDRLVRYVEHLIEAGCAVRTVRKHTLAVRAFHRLHGLPVPDGEPASEVLQTHDASLRAAGVVPKHAEPVSLDVALRLFGTAARDVKVLRGTRDSCLLGLTMGAMMTPAQLYELNRGDVYQTADGTLNVRRGPGDVVELLHWRINGEHEPALCPVEAVAAWCGYLDSRDVARDAPLLRGVDKHEHVAGLDAFAGEVTDGRIDEQAFGVAVRRLAAAAGLETHPTMTELRMGGIVRRRVEGAAVAELAEVSGITSLLRYVEAAEQYGDGGRLIPAGTSTNETGTPEQVRPVP